MTSMGAIYYIKANAFGRRKMSDEGPKNSLMYNEYVFSEKNPTIFRYRRTSHDPQPSKKV